MLKKMKKKPIIKCIFVNKKIKRYDWERRTNTKNEYIAFIGQVGIFSCYRETKSWEDIFGGKCVQKEDMFQHNRHTEWKYGSAVD